MAVRIGDAEIDVAREREERDRAERDERDPRGGPPDVGEEGACTLHV